MSPRSRRCQAITFWKGRVALERGNNLIKAFSLSGDFVICLGWDFFFFFVKDYQTEEEQCFLVLIFNKKNKY